MVIFEEWHITEEQTLTYVRSDCGLMLLRSDGMKRLDDLVKRNEDGSLPFTYEEIQEAEP